MVIISTRYFFFKEETTLQLNTINVIGQIADLKDTDYKNTLAITVLIELLIEKKLFTREEFTHKARELDTIPLSQLVSNRRLELLSSHSNKV